MDAVIDFTSDIYLKIFDAADEGIVIADAEGKITYVNRTVKQNFSKSLKMNKDTWVSKYILNGNKINSNEIIDQFPLIRTLKYQETVEKKVTEIYNDEGKKLYLLISTQPILYKSKLKAAILIYQDITSLSEKNAQLEDLKQNQDLLYSAINAINDIVVITDYYGNVKYINSFGKKFIGLQADEPLSSINIEKYHAPKSWHHLIQTMVPKAIQEDSAQGELIFRDKNNEDIHVSQVLICHKNKSGRIDFFASISRDISELKNINSKIEAQTNYLHSIIEASPNLIYVKNLKGEYKMVNKKFADIFNLKADEIIGKCIQDLSISDERKIEYLNEDKIIINQSKPQNFEEFINEGNLKNKWYKTYKAPLINPNNETEIIGISQDITLEKQIENTLKEQLHLSNIIAQISTYFFSSTPETISGLCNQTLKLLCENVSMQRAALIETTRYGNFKYHYFWSSNPDDFVYKGNLILESVKETQFTSIIKQIKKTGYAYSEDIQPENYDETLQAMLQLSEQQTFLVIPLSGISKKLGYMVLTSNKKVILKDSDFAFLKTVGQILSSSLERNNIEKRLSLRLKFEEIINRHSSKFINIKTEYIESAIQDALLDIANFFNVDQAFIFSNNKIDKTLNLSYSWLKDGKNTNKDRYQNIAYSSFPWAFKIVKTEKFLGIKNLNEIPQEGIAAKTILSKTNIKSMFAVPIIFQKDFYGVYMLASSEKEEFWDNEIVPLLKLFGLIIASAVERKMNDEQLQESEMLHRIIVQNTPNVSVVIFDKNLTIKLIEGKNFNDLNINKKDVEGKKFEVFRNIKFFTNEFNNYNELNELCLRALNGEIITLEKSYLNELYKIYIQPVKNNKEGITAGLIIAFNITDFNNTQIKLKQQALELQRSNEDLEQFAYAASHDLKEPLRMVSSYVHLIERKLGENATSDIKEFIFYVTDGVNRMQELINDLLEYSRIDRQTKGYKLINLNEIIYAVKLNLQKVIQETQTQIIYDDLPQIKGDPSQIISLFQNLIENAIKFRGKKNPEINLGYTLKKNKITIFVKDNGMGIDPDYHDRIFIIFQRLNERNKYPGTGIGLSICKKIVERHGGTIRLKSKINEGTTFFIELENKL